MGFWAGASKAYAAVFHRHLRALKGPSLEIQAYLEYYRAMATIMQSSPNSHYFKVTCVHPKFSPDALGTHSDNGRKLRSRCLIGGV